MNDITIILTSAEAEMFKKYMEHHDLFLTMESQGIFDIAYGKAVFNFVSGNLQNIVKEEIVYHRSK